ncbi:MAG: ATP-dependent DNA helicase RecG [Candidatus Omnitrophota bacterium]
MKNSLDTPIQYLKGVGPKRAKAFGKLGISTVENLLYYFPKRYQDRRNFSSISQLQEGQSYTIKASVLARGQRDSFRKRGFSITEAAVADDSGKIFCVWFNQPYLKNYFKPGTQLLLYGKVERYGERLQMSSPEFEFYSEEEAAIADKFVPVYALAEGMTQRYIRRSIKQALEEFLPRTGDFLPYDIRNRNGLLNLAQSLINIHFPQGLQMQKEAYRRLAFEEFFLFQLPILLRKEKKKEKNGIAHNVKGPLLEPFISSLPFEFTPAQKKVLQEITQDMSAPVAMGRLLQGDVGSGKTVVATAACIIAVQGGYQAAFMAPTEILARQHFEKIKGQGSTVKGQRSINIGLLTSSLDKKEKGKTYQEIKEGKIDLVIGTHALLGEGVNFKNLGLVVIDEQHKFGVGQRALLPKKGINPDVLIMTATPIPRTLAITLYGDLDISVINELPYGRLPVKTMLLKQKDRGAAYDIARQQLRQGSQAYIIYPVIDESYALDIAGAEKMYKELKETEFKDFKLGLIHGRLKQKEQDAAMMKFKEGQLGLLVSTTVLEVGIDIPGATCMIIEHAHRFGLAQLHQLRGRIGRGSKESFCILLSEGHTQGSAARLEAMVKFSDGFRIAEEDLKIRGPGEFFGKLQHGLTELKIADPLAQMQLLKRAREEARRLIGGDPNLEARQNLLLKEKLLQRFPGYEGLMVVG